MFVCQVNVGALRNVICVTFKVVVIETVIDWFSAVIWGAIKMNNSHIGGAGESSCPLESVDQEMCCAGALFSK